MQLKRLHKEIDLLQVKHGHKNLTAIYGAGCVESPKAMLVFMNPTGKNVSASKKWVGLKAPWIGTKNVWKLLSKLNLISKNSFEKTQKLKSGEWTADFAKEIYLELKSSRVFVTNLAKCTQEDARPLSTKTFIEYLGLMKREIILCNPQMIITFGNQVSSILLAKSVFVSNYKNKDEERLQIENKDFPVYPIYYPVGQGMRNMPKAIERLKIVLS